MSDETVIAPRERRRFVGKYRIDGVLGEGAMGVVYAGRDPDIDRPVAIKTIHQHLIGTADSQDWLDRFAREARAAGRVLHPNLVTVFDFLQQDGRPYLVMERIRSITLDDRRAAPDPLPLEEIHALMAQILSGLACIHGAGIVHRDLKPANVMLTDDGTVKLTDFGIARLTAMEATGAGMIGTPSYMAPEQLTGSAVDARADIYACGVMLYELLTGHKPYKGGGVEALFEVMRNGRISPPSELNPGVPTEIDQVVLTAMNVDPDQRFGNADAMRAALETVLPAADRTGLIDVAAQPHRAMRTGGSMSATMLERIDEQTLGKVAQHLTKSIGPMGSIIAHRAAASATSADDMIAAVLAEFSDPDEREEMRRLIQKTLVRTMEASPPGGSNISDETLLRITELLKPHLGPIASVLVRKHANQAPTGAALAEKVADSITDRAERAAFLNAINAAFR